MLSLQPMLLAAALTVTADVEILEFTASWCGPCQEMKGTVDQLRTTGHKVYTVDFDQRQDLAKRFGVTRVPTYLKIVNGQAVDRIVGAVPAQQLVGMIQRPVPVPNRSVAVPARTGAANAVPTRAGLANVTQPSVNSGQQKSFEQIAMDASVRLRVDDAGGHSFGTGTIVDVHQARNSIEGLVLTCGHIFRSSQGKGRITVELFEFSQKGTVTGKLLRHDLDRDLALIAIPLRAPIRPVRIAGSDYRVSRGQPVFSIGCNRGADPTVMRGQINAVNKFLGPENITVSGRPVDGRSGGGLFSKDGFLVGVCNAADPETNEGLYAAYQSIHKKLDVAKLAFVYQAMPPKDAQPDLTRTKDRGPQTVAVPSRTAATSAPAAPSQTVNPVASTNSMQNIDRQREAEILNPQQGRAEVICIIRTPGSPEKDRLVILDRPSREFMARLAREDHNQRHRKLTELRVERRIDRPAGER